MFVPFAIPLSLAVATAARVASPSTLVTTNDHIRSKLATINTANEISINRLRSSFISSVRPPASGRAAKIAEPPSGSLVEVSPDNFLEYFQLVGTTPTYEAPRLTITPDSPQKASTTTLKDDINFALPFTLEGLVSVGDKSYLKNGADGVAFSFHTGGSSMVGLFGGNLSVGGLPNAVAFKIDTWPNLAVEPQPDAADLYDRLGLLADPDFDRRAGYCSFLTTDSVGAISYPGLEDGTDEMYRTWFDEMMGPSPVTFKSMPIENFIEQNPTIDLADITVDPNDSHIIAAQLDIKDMDAQDVRTVTNYFSFTPLEVPYNFSIGGSTGSSYNEQYFEISKFDYYLFGGAVNVEHIVNCGVGDIIVDLLVEQHVPQCQNGAESVVISSDTLYFTEGTAYTVSQLPPEQQWFDLNSGGIATTDTESPVMLSLLYTPALASGIARRDPIDVQFHYSFVRSAPVISTHTGYGYEGRLVGQVGRDSDVGLVGMPYSTTEMVDVNFELFDKNSDLVAGHFGLTEVHVGYSYNVYRNVDVLHRLRSASDLLLIGEENFRGLVFQPFSAEAKTHHGTLPITLVSNNLDFTISLIDTTHVCAYAFTGEALVTVNEFLDLSALIPDVDTSDIAKLPFAERATHYRLTSQSVSGIIGESYSISQYPYDYRFVDVYAAATQLLTWLETETKSGKGKSSDISVSTSELKALRRYLVSNNLISNDILPLSTSIDTSNPSRPVEGLFEEDLTVDFVFNIRSIVRIEHMFDSKASDFASHYIESLRVPALLGDRMGAVPLSDTSDTHFEAVQLAENPLFETLPLVVASVDPSSVVNSVDGETDIKVSYNIFGAEVEVTHSLLFSNGPPDSIVSQFLRRDVLTGRIGADWSAVALDVDYVVEGWDIEYVGYVFDNESGNDVNDVNADGSGSGNQRAVDMSNIITAPPPTGVFSTNQEAIILYYQWKCDFLINSYLLTYRPDALPEGEKLSANQQSRIIKPSDIDHYDQELLNTVTFANCMVGESYDHSGHAEDSTYVFQFPVGVMEGVYVARGGELNLYFSEGISQVIVTHQIVDFNDDVVGIIKSDSYQDSIGTKYSHSPMSTADIVEIVNSGTDQTILKPGLLEYSDVIGAPSGVFTSDDQNVTFRYRYTCGLQVNHVLMHSITDTPTTEENVILTTSLWTGDLAAPYQITLLSVCASSDPTVSPYSDPLTGHFSIDLQTVSIYYLCSEIPMVVEHVSDYSGIMVMDKFDVMADSPIDVNLLSHLPNSKFRMSQKRVSKRSQSGVSKSLFRFKGVFGEDGEDVGEGGDEEDNRIVLVPTSISHIVNDEVVSYIQLPPYIDETAEWIEGEPAPTFPEPPLQVTIKPTRGVNSVVIHYKEVADVRINHFVATKLINIPGGSGSDLDTSETNDEIEVSDTGTTSGEVENSSTSPEDMKQFLPSKYRSGNRSGDIVGVDGNDGEYELVQVSVKKMFVGSDYIVAPITMAPNGSVITIVRLDNVSGTVMMGGVIGSYYYGPVGEANVAHLIKRIINVGTPDEKTYYTVADYQRRVGELGAVVPTEPLKINVVQMVGDMNNPDYVTDGDASAESRLVYRDSRDDPLVVDTETLYSSVESFFKQNPSIDAIYEYRMLCHVVVSFFASDTSEFSSLSDDKFRTIRTPIVLTGLEGTEFDVGQLASGTYSYDYPARHLMNTGIQSLSDSDNCRIDHGPVPRAPDGGPFVCNVSSKLLDDDQSLIGGEIPKYLPGSTSGPVTTEVVITQAEFEIAGQVWSVEDPKSQITVSNGASLTIEAVQHPHPYLDSKHHYIYPKGYFYAGKGEIREGVVLSGVDYVSTPIMVKVKYIITDPPLYIPISAAGAVVGAACAAGFALFKRNPELPPAEDYQVNDEWREIEDDRETGVEPGTILYE